VDLAFVCTSPPSETTVTGAHVAETEFLRALVRHGSFCSLRVFWRAARQQRAELQATLSAGRADDRLQLHNLDEIPQELARRPPDLLLTPYLFVSQLAYFRDIISAAPFPICGLVHAIAHIEAKVCVQRNMMSAYHDLDLAICPSQAAQTALTSLAGEIAGEQGWPTQRRPRTIVAPLGVDAGRFGAGAKDSLRDANGIARDEVVFLYVGRLCPWTKMDLTPLLVAFAEVVRRVGDRPVRLLIVGQEQTPGYAMTLAAVAAELDVGARVEIWTSVAGEALPSVYAMADVFVSPCDNIQETFGLTLVEAMASRLPVVASDWSGYREIVDDGQTGYLVPTLSAPAGRQATAAAFYAGYRSSVGSAAQTTAVNLDVLVDRMARLAVDEARRMTMGAQGRAAVERRYDWAVVIAAYEGIWADQRARAGQSPPDRSALQSVYWSDVARHFGHFASDRWRDDAILRRSTTWRRLDAPAIGRLARLAGVREDLILKIERQASDVHGASICAVAGSQADLPELRRAALFMLKHGILRIEGVKP
jgi:glycosyltransferase involved in cell wall biosynthesis